MKTDSAFERFCTNEAKAVFTAVYLMCRDRQLAEDASQEAFARAVVGSPNSTSRLENRPSVGSYSRVSMSTWPVEASVRSRARSWW